MALHQRLFLVLLVFLPTQLGFHFWPEWSYVLGRRIDYLSPTVYLTDILVVSIVAKFLISNFKFLIKQRNFQIVVLFAALNIFFAKSQPVAAYKWLKVFEFVGLGWYIVSTRPKLSDISRQLSVGVLYSSLIAIGQFFMQRSIGGPLWLLGERTFDVTTPGIARWEGFGSLLLRPYGTFPHPNVLGGFLAITLPILLRYIKQIRRIGLISVFLGLIALTFSFSRSAWIAAGLGIGAIYFFRKRHVPVIVLALLLVSAAFIFKPSYDDESVVRRSALNSTAITMWRMSPWIGVGLGNFIVELPSYNINRQGNYLQPAHNIYLLLLSEIGVVGILGLIGALWGIRKKIRMNVALVTILILGLVDHYPLTLQQGQLLFIIVLSTLFLQDS